MEGDLHSIGTELSLDQKFFFELLRHENVINNLELQDAVLQTANKLKYPIPVQVLKDLTEERLKFINFSLSKLEKICKTEPVTQPTSTPISHENEVYVDLTLNEIVPYSESGIDYLRSLFHNNRGNFQYWRAKGMGNENTIRLTPENCGYLNIKEFPWNLLQGADKQMTRERADSLVAEDSASKPTENIPQIVDADGSGKPQAFPTAADSGVVVEPVGQRVEALPAPENPLVTQEMKELIMIGNNKYEIAPNRTYGTIMVSAMLRQIHSEFFGHPKNIEKAMEIMNASNGQVLGKNIIIFTGRVNDIGFLSTNSTRKFLEDKLNESYSYIEQHYFTSPNYAIFVHTFPELMGPQLYIKKKEIQKMCEIQKRIKGIAVEEALEKTRLRELAGKKEAPAPEIELEKLIDNYHQKMNEKSAMPSGSHYNFLVRAGVLDNTTHKSVRESYGNYLEKMACCQYYDLDKVRLETELDWPAFGDKFLLPLQRINLAKDIGHDLGLNTSCNFWVIKKGYRDQIKKALDEQIKGWEPYDFEKLSSLSGMDVDDFEKEFLEPFMKNGKIRDLSQEFNLSHHHSYYVIMPGYREQVEISIKEHAKIVSEQLSEQVLVK